MSLKPLGFTVDGVPIGVPCPDCTDNTTPKGSPMSTPNFMSPTGLVRLLSQRYNLVPESEFAEGWPYAEAGGRILAHIDTLEADAREAHSAAKALGCTVADLVDRAKEQWPATSSATEAARILGIAVAGLPNMVTALRRSEAVLADQLKHRHAILTECLGLLGQPDADSYDVVPGLLAAKLRNVVNDGTHATELADMRQQLLTVLHHVNAALPEAHRAVVPTDPGHAADVINRVQSFVAHHGHQDNTLRLLAEEVHDARKALGLTDPHAHLAPAIQALQIEARNAAPMATTLQAITEALPIDLRYTEDIAGAVRQLVLTAETRYGQWSQLREETAPQKQIVGILRELLADSKPLCIALASELYSDDDRLLDLLETLPSERLAATLMESLAVPHDQPIPTTTPPSPQAKALEGPACLDAIYNSGRIEAIGGDLIRFYPVFGDSVILNANRPDLTVFPLTPDELAEEVAKVEARKTAATRAPTEAKPVDLSRPIANFLDAHKEGRAAPHKVRVPDPADDDIPW